MGRSPDSLRNKLVRFHRSSIWKKREEARAWLKAVVLVLELEEPPYWGRADEAHIMEVDDIPLRVPVSKVALKKNTTVYARSNTSFTGVASPGHR